jgi:hypothetical protein
MPKNFPKLIKDLNIQVQEAHKSPITFNPKKTESKHTIIKMSKIKDRE